MSTVLKTAPQPIESPKLRVVPTNLPDRFKGQVDSITSLEAQIIASLPNMEEEEIVELRKNSERLYNFSWAVVAACDAAIWNRNAFKSAPGRSDTEGVGIMAAVVRRAREVNSTYKTIRLNARVYNTFKERLNASVHTLPEKEFYVKALKADDPQAALDQFIEQKRSNPKFSPAMAEKLVNDSKKDATQERVSIAQEYSQPQERSLVEHTVEFLKVVRQYRASCPDKDFAKRMYDQIIEDFEDHIYSEMVDAGTRKAVVAAYEAGCRTVDQITVRTKLTRKEVEHIVESLAREGVTLGTI